MPIRRESILLLTATIQPLKNLPAFVRTDPALRLRDYERTLRAYLPLLDTGAIARIVFVENSAADLTSLKNLANDSGFSERIEFVSFYGLDFEPVKGRGYGEFKSVDHAMATANCLRDNADVVVWKCTGRYLIRNLETLVRNAPDEFDLQCHCRDYPSRLCELYLVAWNRRGYEELIRGIYVRLANDSVSGVHTIEETLFRKLVDQARQTLIVIPRFKTVPLLDGMRAWNNTPKTDRWYSPKILARRVCGYLLPSVWI